MAEDEDKVTTGPKPCMATSPASTASTSRAYSRTPPGRAAHHAC
ncbi:hypothetical protein [Streptomyces sp. H27-C3]|nr:hypothetical protein [Streptomyces sp. H27-C3]MDJ0464098.1 hypothetical protein [Streptomyces sp. H27-C3]